MSANSIRPTRDIEVPENHLLAVLAVHKVTEPVAVVGVRGFTKSIANAESGENLTGVYDDAICIITRFKTLTFPANTDPSRTVTGRAVLMPGRYRYTRGVHGITGPKEKQRPAWVQHSGVTIRRYQENGQLGPVVTGAWIGLNIHDGSITTTGSAGCQTIVPERWKDFDTALEEALKAEHQDAFWYVLTT
jgi:hypothetical protein